MNKRLLLGVLTLGVLAGVGLYFYRAFRPAAAQLTRLRAWLQSPQSHPEWRMRAGVRCGEAPFLFPTDGYIGFLWDDSFRSGHRHQGIDIFAGTEAGVTPVFAVYPGYLTRLPEWKSSLIVRLPSDPLQPGRQIWVYYTHMADADGHSYISEAFPPGTYEQPIEAGTLLGYQGNYSGDPNNPTGVHLHLSIVLDDGRGHFRNELDIRNTLDPSPYLGLPLNANTSDGGVPVCEAGDD
ncbi:MAG: hypothetical protein ABWK53_01685 [Anaerolineales bacterium]